MLIAPVITNKLISDNEADGVILIEADPAKDLSRVRAALWDNAIGLEPDNNLDSDKEPD